MAGALPGSTIDAECQAVYQQVQKQGFAAPRIMAEDGFKIEKTLYLTGQEAKATYNADANIQDDSHVCYVLVRGNIGVGSPFTNTIAIYSTGFAFYDPESLLYLEIGSGRDIIKVIVPTVGSSTPAAPQ
jgi:hypothetical protein